MAYGPRFYIDQGAELSRRKRVVRDQDIREGRHNLEQPQQIVKRVITLPSIRPPDYQKITFPPPEHVHQLQKSIGKVLEAHNIATAATATTSPQFNNPKSWELFELAQRLRPASEQEPLRFYDGPIFAEQKCTLPATTFNQPISSKVRGGGLKADNERTTSSTAPKLIVRATTNPIENEVGIVTLQAGITSGKKVTAPEGKTEAGGKVPHNTHKSVLNEKKRLAAWEDGEGDDSDLRPAKKAKLVPTRQLLPVRGAIKSVNGTTDQATDHNMVESKMRPRESGGRGRRAIDVATFWPPPHSVRRLRKKHR